MTRARPFNRHFARKFRPLEHTGLHEEHIAMIRDVRALIEGGSE